MKKLLCEGVVDEGQDILGKSDINWWIKNHSTMTYKKQFVKDLLYTCAYLYKELERKTEYNSTILDERTRFVKNLKVDLERVGKERSWIKFDSLLREFRRQSE